MQVKELFVPLRQHLASKLQRRIRNILVTALLFCAVTTFVACRPQYDVVPAQDTSGFTARTRHTMEAFGTISVLRLYDDFSLEENVARFEATWRQVVDVLAQLDDIFSLNRQDTELARFNALVYGESMEISYHMAQVIKIAQEAYEKTGGLFDPSVFPLVDLWGFSSRFNTNRFVPQLPYDRPEGRGALPHEDYIEAFRQLVNFSGIVLSGNQAEGYQLAKMIPPVVVNGVAYQAQLDFGALLKGYAVDLVHAILMEAGFSYGFFSCGGSSIVFLRGIVEENNHQIEVNLRKPRPGQGGGSSFARVYLSQVSISTSGDYDHAFFLDGIRYSHVFDPRTGRPIHPPQNGVQEGVASATVIGPSGVQTEAISTALLVMSLEEARAFVSQNLDYQMVLVYVKNTRDYFEVMHNMPQGSIVFLDSAFVEVGLHQE